MMEKIVEAFSNKIDKNLAQDLVDQYIKMAHHFLVENYSEGLVFAGQFCETTWKIILFSATGEKKDKLIRKDKLLRQIENYTNVSDQERILIPRLAAAIYDIRNKKRSSHATNIIPTKNDSKLVQQACTWILIEFLLLYHKNETENIYKMIEGLLARKVPLFEEIDNKILGTKGISMKRIILYLLYQYYPNPITRDDLRKKLAFYSSKKILPAVSILKKENKIVENEEKKLFLRKDGLEDIQDFLISKKFITNSDNFI